MIPKGTLIAIGGAEDKGLESDEKYNLDFIQDGILSHVVARSGGNESRIVVITSASSIPREVGEKYSEAFGKLGCKKVDVVHVESAKAADSKNLITILQDCDAIMFSGGNQNKLTQIFRNSISIDVIRQRYIEEQFVVAGTSAGAVAMSEVMIKGGCNRESMIKGAVQIGEGLGFIQNVIFDSHFIRRGRFGRLTEAVAIHDHLLGIGLAEDTGLIIEKGNDFTTIGSGMVLLFDASELSHNTVKDLAESTPISISNLRIHVLANSDRYFLKEKKVEILPIDAEFI